MQPSSYPRPPNSARKMKGVALAALLLCVVLLLVAHYYGRQGAWAWVAAFAEAGTVGALADWFAVTALFRHPLGLPIPHTAIIPKNQQRIANNLAEFVRDKFLEPQMLVARLESMNPAQKLGEFLLEPRQLRMVSLQLRRWVGQSIKSLNNPALEQEVVQLVQKHLHDWDAAPTAGKLFQGLAQSQYQEALLNAGLEKLADWVSNPHVREIIAGKMATVARREYPKATWVTDKLDYTNEIASSLADRLAQAMIQEVIAVLQQPEHALRQHYAQEIKALLLRLENDPTTQAKVRDAKNQLLDSPALQGYVGDMWGKVHQWLQKDLRKSDSQIAKQFERYALRIGQKLRDDPVWQRTANEQLRIAAHHMAEILRDIAPKHIQRTVQEWDSQYMVQEIERSVGKDLQFIRINGTVIGGLVGLILHALLR